MTVMLVGVLGIPAVADTLATAGPQATAGGSSPLRPYLPILLLLALSVAQAVMMVMMSHMASPTRRTPAKSSPYESGIVPLGDTRARFSVKFYLVAILFIVFDIETIFLIPWAVIFRDLGLFGLIEVLIFVLVLAVGLVYAWKKGALRWD